MEEFESTYPKKSIGTLFMEIIVIRCVVLVGGVLGWFIGNGKVKNQRATNQQLLSLIHI